MPRLLLAAGDLHKLLKLQHPSLAAGPSFAALVENGLARVVLALLVVARDLRIVRRFASAPLAGRVRGDLEVRVVRVGLLWRRGGRRAGRSGHRRRLRCVAAGNWSDFGRRRLFDSGGRSWHIGCLLGLFFRRVVDGRVLARGAGRDFEEFVKGQHARLAAFPA